MNHPPIGHNSMLLDVMLLESMPACVGSAVGTYSVFENHGLDSKL